MAGAPRPRARRTGTRPHGGGLGLLAEAALSTVEAIEASEQLVAGYDIDMISLDADPLAVSAILAGPARRCQGHD